MCFEFYRKASVVVKVTFMSHHCLETFMASMFIGKQVLLYLYDSY